MYYLANFSNLLCQFIFSLTWKKKTKERKNVNNRNKIKYLYLSPYSLPITLTIVTGNYCMGPIRLLESMKSTVIYFTTDLLLWIRRSDSIQWHRIGNVVNPLESFCSRMSSKRLIGRVFANSPGDVGSIPCRFISKTLKMVLDTPCLALSNIRYVSKVEQSREMSSVLSFILVS